MEMRVDPMRIRSERERRAWSQQHLAAVAGLSLRTIQRIEATGAASYESLGAIAAVFGLAVAELRPVAASEVANRGIAGMNPAPAASTLRPAVTLPVAFVLVLLAWALWALIRKPVDPRPPMVDAHIERPVPLPAVKVPDLRPQEAVAVPLAGSATAVAPSEATAPTPRPAPDIQKQIDAVVAERVAIALASGSKDKPAPSREDRIQKIAERTQKSTADVERILQISNDQQFQRPNYGQVFAGTKPVADDGTRLLEDTVFNTAWRVLGDLGPLAIDIDCRPEACSVRLVFADEEHYQAAARAAPFESLIVALAEYGFDGMSGRAGRDPRGPSLTAYLWRKAPTQKEQAAAPVVAMR